MAHAKSFNYFDAYLDLTTCCMQSIAFVQDVLSYSPIALDSKAIHEIHEIENKADKINHAIQEHLYSDFIVPLERDNMALIANDLDDVIDSIEEIMIRMYIYHIREADDTMREMAKLIEKSVTSLHSALTLLADSKKNTAINQALISIHDTEDEGDKLYIKALCALYNQSEITGESRQLIHRIYDTFEHALDHLEHTAENVQSVITQNV